MTIFVAHTDADEEIANALAKVIERRGNFVEHEEPERIGRPLMGQDALVLLWSQAMLFDPGRLVMERRALDAWADGKLVLVILDRTFLPVGMRDLPVIDATFEQKRQFTWEEVATRLRELLQASAAQSVEIGSSAAPAGMARRRAAPAARRKSGGGKAGGGVSALLLLFLIAAGIWQVAARVMITLPLSMANASLGDFVLPPWSLLGLAGLVGFVALVIVLMRHDKARAQAKKSAAAAPVEDYEPPQAEAEQAAPATSSAIFVSYAHADGASVAPVVEAVKHEGREVWMDGAGIKPGEGWAGEIVRAIKSAHGVLVMCSPHAFESDHVKREVYLADRYKKPMLPVFLEDANLPEDFEYFFAGVQWLELHKTPEADRAAAIARAVAAV